MAGQINETATRVSVDHFLAGLAFWAALMVVVAIF